MAIQPTLYDPYTHSHLITQFASLHIECITHDHTIATFVPPLSHPKVQTCWQERAAEVGAGSREILFSTDPDGSGCVAGVVMLSKPDAETGPFRAAVEKLLDTSSWRRKGVARALMKRLEDVASEKGRNLLILDTETGSPAEMMYPRLGYIKVGVIPKFGISPKDGTLKSETFFYKDLGSTNPL